MNCKQINFRLQRQRNLIGISRKQLNDEERTFKQEVYNSWQATAKF